MIGKRIIASAVLAGAALAGAQAAAQESRLVIKLSGSGSWRISCDLTRADGETIVREKRGRGGLLQAIGETQIAGGTCRYSTPKSGSLNIRFSDESGALACPLTEVEGVCLARIGGGESGEFSF